MRFWRTGLASWEEQVETRLPLVSLQHLTGLDSESIVRGMAVGLVEEDVRFGAVYEMLNGIAGQPRPTLGLLQSWWAEADEAISARHQLLLLQELDLLEVANPEAMRLEWGLQVPAFIWDALRGPVSASPAGGPAMHFVRGVTYRAPDQLVQLTDVILPKALYEKTARLPELFEAGQIGGSAS